MAERSVVEILLRARGAREVYDSSKLASRGISDIGKAAVTANQRSKLLRHGLYGVGAAGATMGVLLYEGAKKSVEAYAEFQGAAAQVDRQIKLTGGSANVTSGHVENLANKLSLTAGIADKFSVLGGESLLLTFRNIRNEGGKTTQLFDRTSRAAIDMTSALKAAGKNTTPQQAFMALGRAVSDPAKAAQYLRRALVTLSPAETAHIKRLIVLNKTTQAQEAVLTAVEKKYKGAAVTAGKTLPGALGRLHVASQNIKEEIGYGLSPVVTDLADQLMGLDKHGSAGFKKLGDDLHRTLSRKDLSLSEKLKLSEDDVKKDLGPLWTVFTTELRNQHLGTKLEHVIEDAAPHIAQGMAHAGVGAAKAFAHAWWDSDIWGKTFTTAFLLHKLGAFSKIGRLLAGGGKGGGLVGKLAPTPVYVTNWGEGGPGGGFNRKYPVPPTTPTPTPTKTTWWQKGAKVLPFATRIAPWAVAAEALAFPSSAGLDPKTERGRLAMYHWNLRTDRYMRRTGVYADSRRLAGFPDSPMTTGAPSSWRNPTRIAFPVMRATANIRSIVMLPDGTKLADTSKRAELTYKPGGRG